MADEKTKPNKGQEAFDVAVKGSEVAVAAELKKRYNLLKLALSTESSTGANDGVTLVENPSNDEFRRMAKEAIGTEGQKTPRGFKVKDKDGKDVFVSFDDLAKRIKAAPKTNAPDTLNGGDISSIVPTREQVNKVATAIKEAVADNTGNGKGGASVGNTLSGLGSIIWSRDTDAGKKKVAENFREAVTNKLQELKKNDPSVAGFLTDEKIKEIGQKTYQTVLDEADGKKPDTSDPLDKVKIEEVDQTTREAVRQFVRDRIAADAKKSADEGIEKGIQENIKKIRDGGGIMGFLMTILDLFGLGDTVARWFAPSQTEASNLSTNIADTVSDVLTRANYKYNDKTIPQMNESELQEAVQSELQKTLKANKGQYPKFTDEQLDEVAKKAAEAIKDKQGEIKKIPPVIYGPTASINWGKMPNLSVTDMGAGFGATGGLSTNAPRATGSGLQLS